MKARLAFTFLGLLLIVASVRAKGMEGWKPIASSDGTELELSSLARYGANVYALDNSGAAYLVESGVAKPVKTIDGDTLSFKSIAGVAGGAIGAEADGNSVKAWKLDGTTATPVLDESDQPLVTDKAYSTPADNAPGCPYFWARPGSSAGAPPPPPGMKVTMNLYWLSGDKALPVDLPELKVPVFRWTGKHLLLTNRGKTQIFVEGKVKDLFCEGGDVWLDAASPACDDYFLLDAGIHLYHIEGETAVAVPNADNLRGEALFRIDGATHISLSSSAGNDIMKLDGAEMTETPYSKLLKDNTARTILVADGIAVAENEGGKGQLLVMRDGKGKVVKLPKGGEDMAINRLEAGFGGQHVMLAQGATSALWVLDAKNKLKVVACAESKYYIDPKAFVFGEDGIYQHYTGEDRKQKYIYHDKP